MSYEPVMPSPVEVRITVAIPTTGDPDGVVAEAERALRERFSAMTVRRVRVKPQSQRAQVD